MRHSCLDPLNFGSGPDGHLFNSFIYIRSLTRPVVFMKVLETSLEAELGSKGISLA